MRDEYYRGTLDPNKPSMGTALYGPSANYGVEQTNTEDRTMNQREAMFTERARKRVADALRYGRNQLRRVKVISVSWDSECYGIKSRKVTRAWSSICSAMRTHGYNVATYGKSDITRIESC